MNSHKQLPKFILKIFTDTGCDKGKLFCYNVLDRTFSVTSPKLFNAEPDYYSEKMEQQLSKSFERPLGILVSRLKEVFNSQQIILNRKEVQTIYNYLYMLLARSPKMHSVVQEKFVFEAFYTLQSIHDFTIDEALKLMRKENLFNDYKLTVLFNRTEEDFLLASDGYTQYQAGQEIVLILPVSPKIAFMLYKGTDVHDGNIVYATTEYLLRLNTITVEEQEQRRRGYVLSSKKEQLEKAIDSKKQLK